MAKMKLQDLITILNSDVVKNNTSIEMNFSIDDDREYEDCWVGKIPDKEVPNKEVY